MNKVFVDTNILLDLLLEREPWAEDAAYCSAWPTVKRLNCSVAPFPSPRQSI